MNAISASDFARHYGTDLTTAELFFKLQVLCQRSPSWLEPGWTAPKVSNLADWLDRSEATIYRCLKELRRLGVVVVQRFRWNRSPRIRIRCLLRLRKRSVEGAVEGAVIEASKMKKNTKPSAGAADRPKKLLSLKTLAEVKVPPEPTPNPLPPSPGSAQDVAIYWNKLLRARGYAAFPKDVKHLAHVKHYLSRGKDMLAELPSIIEDWPMYRENEHHEPHPWCVLRALDSYFDAKAQKDTPPEPVHVSAQKPSPAPAQPVKGYPTLAEKFAAKFGKKAEDQGDAG